MIAYFYAMDALCIIKQSMIELNKLMYIDKTYQQAVNL